MRNPRSRYFVPISRFTEEKTRVQGSEGNHPRPCGPSGVGLLGFVRGGRWNLGREVDRDTFLLQTFPWSLVACRTRPHAFARLVFGLVLPAPSPWLRHPPSSLLTASLSFDPWAWAFAVSSPYLRRYLFDVSCLWVGAGPVLLNSLPPVPAQDLSRSRCGSLSLFRCLL